MVTAPKTATEPRSLSRAIHRYFEVSLYLLVLTGVGTLASTGTLSFATILPVGAALIFRGYLLAKRRTLMIPEQWTTALTIGYVIFYLLDYFVISGGFLNATIHLVLFVMVVRLFSTRRERDYYFLSAIAFLMVLAAAVVTVDSVFLATFAIFIVMAIVTLILLEMKRASAQATVEATITGDNMPHRHMAFSIVGIVPVLVVLTLLAGSVIFFILPRISVGYFSAFSANRDLTTGFSDRVELGGIGRIQQSSAVVMHIRIDGDDSGRFDLKWRGIALNLFDGQTWSNTHGKFRIDRGPDGKFALAPEDGQLGMANSGSPRLLHYRVLAEPLGSNIFFLAPTALSLSGNYRAISEDKGGAIFDSDGDHAVNQYEATSNIAEPIPVDLRDGRESYPAEILFEYLQLPVLDPRIPQLSRQITVRKANNYDRAVAIEHYLRTHYGYTLQLSRSRPRDPLAEFLFVRKQGHCEYFASSMAIMLRTLGIPSRVVNGFRSGQFNDLTSQYVIRESDAHSWVEAYFPEYGWITFDPTPPGARGAHSDWDRSALYLDAMASFWRTWIVNYDISHQYRLGQIASHDSRQWFFKTRHWARHQYMKLLLAVTRAQANMRDRPGSWGVWGFLSLVVLAVPVLGRRCWLFVRARRLSANPAKFPRMAATIWYERMVRKVSRRGWKKHPAQTPSEFVTSIEDNVLRQRVSAFTSRYEKARFGNSEEDANSLPELFEEISSTSGK